jgi:SAM-dependent methyltransferase
MVVDEHRQYLSDEPRLSAFREAIARVVKPGDVVVDLGAGTGILGLLACRAGAARVYAIDEGGMIQLAREICRANGFADRVTFIREASERATLPERADVVVADQIGRFGFEAGLLEYFSDARARFLKPGGRMIPVRVTLEVAPVEHSDLSGQVEFWTGRPEGFDVGPARAVAANTGYPARFRPEHLLAIPARLALLDLATATPEPFRGGVTVEVTRDGTLHGVGGWFAADLAPGVTMSNGPLAPTPINRHNVFFPINCPVTVKRGDRVRIAMRIIPGESLVTWTVEAGGRRFAHSTFRGMLIAPEDLARTQPGFRPRLSPWGEARRTVLALCDGRRPLAEIEGEVHARHANLFGSAAAAARFVAEVVTRYAV